MNTTEKAQTIQDLTDSIIAVYGDEREPDRWRRFVLAVTLEFGTHPMGAANTKQVPAAFAARWRAAFGIS